MNVFSLASRKVLGKFSILSIAYTYLNTVAGMWTQWLLCDGIVFLSFHEHRGLLVMAWELLCSARTYVFLMCQPQEGVVLCRF